jgi:hypothetical protein
MTPEHDVSQLTGNGAVSWETKGRVQVIRLGSPPANTIGQPLLGWGWQASIVTEVAQVSLAAGPAGSPLNPLHPRDIDTVAAHLGPLGAAVTSTRCASAGLAGTITLARSAHPSLQAASIRFTTSCPTHHNRFCLRSHRHGGHNCPWYSNEHGVRWPSDPWPGRGGSS